MCPACETTLPEQDDVVVAQLNPTNAYRTSVLAGLHPSVILDVAGRALNFHSYQVAQEALFQALTAKSSQERIGVLEAQCENIVREATSEINLLKERLSIAEKDLEIERRKVRELHETHKQNAKAYQKLKSQCDKLQQRALLNSTNNAIHSHTQLNNRVSPSLEPQSRFGNHSQLSAINANRVPPPISTPRRADRNTSSNMPWNMNPGGTEPLLHQSSQRTRRPLQPRAKSLPNQENITPSGYSQAIAFKNNAEGMRGVGEPQRASSRTSQPISRNSGNPAGLMASLTNAFRPSSAFGHG